ncbi:MAG: hypothetical protein ACYS8W_10475 [Planctomycetota bacterium]|jgi:tetratricopeptide (TPR) repeat protein
MKKIPILVFLAILTGVLLIAISLVEGAPPEEKRLKFEDVAKMTQRQLDMYDIRLEDILFLVAEEANPSYPALKYKARFAQWSLHIANLLPLKKGENVDDPQVEAIEKLVDRKFGPEESALVRFRRLVRAITYTWQVFVVPDTGAEDEYRIDFMFKNYRASRFGLGLLEIALLEACTLDDENLALRYGFNPVWTPEGLAIEYNDPDKQVNILLFPDCTKPADRQKIEANEDAVSQGYYCKPLTNENLVGLILYYRGKLLLEAGHTEKALSDLKLSVARFPMCLESQLVLGRTQLAIGIINAERDLMRHAAGTFQRIRERISPRIAEAYRLEGVAAVEQARLLMRTPEIDRTAAEEEDLKRVLKHARNRFDDLQKLKPKSNLAVFYIGYLDMVEGLGSDTPAGDAAIDHAEKNFRAFLKTSKDISSEAVLREQAESHLRRLVIEKYVRPLGRARATDVDRFDAVKALIQLAEDEGARIPYYETVPELLDGILPLIKLLDHDNWKLRWHASKALSKITGKSFGLSAVRWNAWLRIQRDESRKLTGY